MTQAIRNRVPELLSAKEQAEGREISLQRFSLEAEINYNTAQKWYKQQVSRFDEDTVLKICNYFQCDVGDLLEIVHST